MGGLIGLRGNEGYGRWIFWMTFVVTFFFWILPFCKRNLVSYSFSFLGL